MAEKKQFRAIKGVRDILPPESAAWNRVEQIAREVFEAYGYGEIRLPDFEETELFARSIGMETDVVAKEMYSFEDRPEIEAPDFENLQSLAEFERRIREAIEEGQVRPSERNNLLATEFGDERRKLTEYVQELKAKGVEDDEAWNKTISQLTVTVKAALKLELGIELTLRPEATASVCRAYIEHGMHTRPGNVKLYYIGPMFRRERPQKGRYRQFYQVGAEVLGQSDAPAIDAELIEMLLQFFARIGLGEGSATSGVKPPLQMGAALQSPRATSGQASGAPTTEAGLTLYYNSIGCRECRPKYVAALKTALEKVRDKLGPDSQRRIETNPLRVLDSKVESEQAVIETLPRIGEHLCAACREHLAALREQFKLRGIEGVQNWRLVRGLDYYTRTTFEITAPGLGSQNAVCGGGRYDGLVELLGGAPTKGIGFAIGTDRVMLALEHLGKLAAPAGCDVFVAWMGAASQAHAIRIARKLRDAGFSVEVPPEELKFRKSLDLANRLGARFALIIGDNEIAAGRYALKRLADGVQKELTEGELVEFLSGDRAIG
jgi:histidyl-tRNA synthetase